MPSRSNTSSHCPLQSRCRTESTKPVVVRNRELLYFYFVIVEYNLLQYRRCFERHIYFPARRSISRLERRHCTCQCIILQYMDLSKLDIRSKHHFGFMDTRKLDVIRYYLRIGFDCIPVRIDPLYSFKSPEVRDLR